MPRIAMISDIHGNLAALTAVPADGVSMLLVGMTLLRQERVGELSDGSSSE
ncbi:MAG: hypothetical protein ABIS00_00915 [Gemmatimonadales bacterium]